MATISKRAETIQPSITLKISALAKQLKAEGQDVIEFGVGEPDFDTPAHIADAGVAAIRAGKTRYTAESGIPELKQAICDKLSQDNELDYRPENIVISCGAKHSIYNVIMALVDPGDEVIIPAPYWVSYPEMVRLADGIPVVVETDDTSEFRITPAQLKAALTPRTKVVILNTPSNPTGMMYNREEIQALAAVLTDHSCFIISDEIYEKLVYSAAPHLSIAAVAPQIKARTIVVNGVSKSYAMTGWRIGYIAAEKLIADAAARIQGHSTSNPTTISQWAALTAMTADQNKVQEMRDVFAERRVRMVQLLNAIPNVTCLEPTGAFYAFPNVKKCYGKSTPSGKKISNSLEFCAELLAEAKVACVPGIGFGSDDYIRLSYATSNTIIEAGIARIHAWINSLS